ncbi:bolA-like protein DDB_G0274169 [Achroia grisella]|uniref:bolA-like protein DDB_G0274169 n=1 Tax=Achroia grisella TaxID=688607 RepID=UPI0027D28C4D|nr:bolA-like protein DDB_G0274169 [Achroia grisella]
MIFLNNHIVISMNNIWQASFGVIRRMSTTGPVHSTILNKLQSALSACHLNVINESYMHNVPKGAETHFKVVVVSDKFDGLPLIKRHRLVNDILKEELQTGVHALSIVAKTPQQWEESDKVVESSPNCKGGFGK